MSRKRGRTELTAKAKAKGSQFESAVRDWLRERGEDVERLRLVGALDEGDLVVQEGFGVVHIIECKATARLDASGFVSQAVTEAANYAKARGMDTKRAIPIVVWKRPRQPIGKALVITTLEEYFA